jgi:hypothetical protein
MNKAELKKKLVQAGVSPQAYSLEGGLPNGRYVLNRADNRDGTFIIANGEIKTSFIRSIRNQQLANSS